MSASGSLSNPQLATRLLRESVFALGQKYIVFSVIVLFAAVVGLAPPQLYRYFIQLAQTNADDLVFKISVIGGSIAICLFLSSFLVLIGKEWLRCEFESFLRRKLLNSLSETELAQLETVHRGEWIERVSSDLLQTERFLTEAFPDQLKNFFLIVGAAAIFMYYSSTLGLLLVATAIALAMVNRAMQRRLRPVLDNLRALHSDVYQRLIENFEGLRTIRSFRGEAMVGRLFNEKLKVIKTISLKMVRWFALVIGTNDLICQLAITGILAGTLYQIESNKMSFDDAIAYPFYMGVFFNSLAIFVRSLHDWNLFFVKGGRLASLFYELPAKAGAENRIKTLMISTETLTELVICGVELRYPGCDLLVPPFDFTISPSGVIGIVGPSGCGKSTFLEFLAGLRPFRVNALHCGENFKHQLLAKNEKVLLPTELSAYTEQRPYIFEGTFADNLRLGCNYDSTDGELWEVLEAAGLARFVRDLPKDLNCRLLDRGQNLSEGQKYRLGIARALLSKKPFLLLDEPFATLDRLSIEILLELIKKERNQRGIVIVTHYLPPNLSFDRIIDFNFLDAGRGDLRKTGSSGYVDGNEFVPPTYARTASDGATSDDLH